MQTLTLMEDIDSLKATFGEDLIEYIKGGQLNRFELFGQDNIMYFKVYNITQPLSKPHKFIIIQSREDLAILCQSKKAKELMTDCYSPRITDNEKQLYNIFSLLLKNDGDNLEKLEEHISKTEDNLVERVKMDYQREIVGIRKSLMVLKKYYYQLLRVFEGISENENELFSSNGLALLHIIEKRLDRLHGNTVNMREYVSQLHEAYLADMDLEQNSIMKVFTVVSTIFLPLGLITGWYGMNLKMPETQWAMGYPFVITIAVFVVVGCLYYFRRKKWF